MKQFSDFIKSKISIEATELKIILSKFKERSVKKGEFVLKKGQIANQYFFIKAGAIRFYFGEYGNQSTSWVVFQNVFFTEISSLSPNIPTRFNIEAIEKTELLYIDKSEMETLYQQFPSWQEFGRKTWEAMAVQMIDEILSFQTLSAEKRYLQFLKTPDLTQRVPIKTLASLLGITPNALSRNRKNMK